MKRTVNCPNCGTAVVWEAESRWRPFCSERCKLIDMGAWASDAYRVEAQDEPQDEAGELPGA